LEHLKQYLDSIVAIGGEGLVLAHPQSVYTPGRAYTLFKVKQFEDEEVKLLKVGETGLLCERSCGSQCIIKCFYQVLREPPPLGSILTIKHNGHHKNGTLKNPIFRQSLSSSRIDNHI